MPLGEQSKAPQATPACEADANKHRCNPTRLLISYNLGLLGLTHAPPREPPLSANPLFERTPGLNAPTVRDLLGW